MQQTQYTHRVLEAGEIRLNRKAAKDVKRRFLFKRMEKKKERELIF
jgi:hypothetical protein